LLALLTFFYYYAWKDDQLCSKMLPQIHDVTCTDKHITIHWYCIDDESTCNISDNSI